MLLIGHRGAPASEPENTLASFRAALAAGADGIETDVRLTADGEMFLMHDDDVSRTTNGSGRLSALAAADVRGWLGADGSAIPTPADLLEFAAGKTRLYLELKATLTDTGYISAAPIAPALAPSLAGIGDITVSSFDPAAILEMRDCAPHVVLALGALPFFDPLVTIDAAMDMGVPEIHIDDSAATEPVFARAREIGARLLVFTVNDVARAHELAAWGAYGIFTDDPGRLRAAIPR